jgi:hypothetical protein
MSDTAPPPGAKISLDIRGVAPESIHIGGLENGQTVMRFDCDAVAAADIAALLLQCAYAASKHLVELTQSVQGYGGRVVPVSRVGLAENRPSHDHTLIMEVGAATIGFALQSKNLAELGRTVLAPAPQLGAETDVVHAVLCRRQYQQKSGDGREASASDTVRCT